MDAALLLTGGHTGDQNGGLRDVDGTSALRHVADGLPERIDEIVVSCRPDQRETIAGTLDGIDYRLAVNPVPDSGPVAALRTGFRIATGSTVAVVDCDSAAVDRALLEALFEAVDTAAVPGYEGRLYPLHAVYDRYEGKRAADRTLAVGSNRLYDLLAQIDPVVVDAAVTDAEDPLSGVGSCAGEGVVLVDPGG